MLSAIVFIPVLIVLSRLGGIWFLLLVEGILIVGCREFYTLMEAKGVHPSKKTGIVVAVLLCLTTYLSGSNHLGFFLAALMIAVTLRELFRTEPAFPIYDISTTVFGVIYVGWLTAHLVLLREAPRVLGLPYDLGSAFLLYAFLMAWGCDTGAYFVGRAFGTRKLFPRVSPKKSVQGAAAGFLSAFAMAFVGRAWFMRDAAGSPLLTVAETAVLGALVGVATQLGDLVESLVKRDAQVKDASHFVPGHGGVLDIFDGLLFSGPVTYYFLTMVAFR